jgi:hypothetical protein
MATARGTFDVKMIPQEPYDTVDGVSLARVSVAKQFHGDLEGASTVEMLAAGTAVKTSAGYVALERIVGTLAGRSGSLVVQHSGTMARGEGRLTISVVPDSGTGELTGIAGHMKIDVIDGKHLYVFDYTFADA